MKQKVLVPLVSTVVSAYTDVSELHDDDSLDLAKFLAKLLKISFRLSNNELLWQSILLLYLIMM